jgi:D-aminopeptidase
MFEVMATTIATQKEVPVTIVAGQVTAIVKMKDTCTIYTADGSSFAATKPSYADICSKMRDLLKDNSATA